MILGGLFLFTRGFEDKLGDYVVLFYFCFVTNYEPKSNLNITCKKFSSCSIHLEPTLKQVENGQKKSKEEAICSRCVFRKHYCFVCLLVCLLA